MIEGQQQSYNTYPPEEYMTKEEYTIALGAQILKAALDYDRLVKQNLSSKAILFELDKRRREYNPKVLAILNDLPVETLRENAKGKQVRIGVNELRVGMVTMQNIVAKSGVVVVAKDQEITYPLLVRLLNFAQLRGIIEPFEVRVEA
jgi:hypothetical protein